MSPRPPLNYRKEKAHLCEGGCGTILPPSSLRYCKECRKNQAPPTRTRIR